MPSHADVVVVLLMTMTAMMTVIVVDIFDTATPTYQWRHSLTFSVSPFIPLTRSHHSPPLLAGLPVLMAPSHVLLLARSPQALEDERYAGLQYINGYDDPAIVAGAGQCSLLRPHV